MVDRVIRIAALSGGIGFLLASPAFGVQPSFGPSALANATGLAGSPGRVALRPVSSTVNPGQAALIAKAIRGSIASLPATALQADIEAQIVFSIDQSNPSLETALAALAAVDRTGLSPAANAALDAVMANRSRLATRGTGSIAGGADIGLAFDTSYSLGGGSSDYTR